MKAENINFLIVLLLHNISTLNKYWHSRERIEQHTLKIVHVFMKNSHQVEQLGEKGKKFLVSRFELYHNSTFKHYQGMFISTD